MAMVTGINKYILNIKMCIDARVYMAIFGSSPIMMSCLKTIFIAEIHNYVSHLQIRTVYCITQSLALIKQHLS